MKKMPHLIKVDDVWKYSGRILDTAGPANPLQIVPDISPSTFVCPVVDRWSPIAYSIMVHAHVELTHHGGVRSTLSAASGIAHVIGGKTLAAEIRSNCGYCKRYKAKLEKAAMGPLPVERMTIAPAFYHTQIDLFGPMDSHCKHGRRAVVKTYGVIFKCCTTLAISVLVMDGYDTSSFLDTFYRFCSRFGIPGKVLIDAGSQLLAAFRTATFSVADLTATVNCKTGVQVEFSVCPVGAHEAHGLVERSVREVKKLFSTVFHGLKMDILRLETVFSWISNELNSLPMCLGDDYKDLEHCDLITPNRLLMGRNNRRAIGGLIVDGHPNRIIHQIEELEQAWWKVWVAEKLQSLIPRPSKWIDGEPNIVIGDVVVFIKDRAEIGGLTWRLGRVKTVETSKDGICRRVVIEYRNAGEAVFRETTRSARHVAVLVREGELDIPGRLSAAQKAASTMFCGWGLRGGPGELHTGPGQGDVGVERGDDHGDVGVERGDDHGERDGGDDVHSVAA